VGTDSATSGTARDPWGAGLSGYVTRLAHVAYGIAGVTESAGSSEGGPFWETKCAAPPVAGALGGADATATQTCPAADARAFGVPPRWIVFCTFPDAGSRRMTAPSSPFATQSAAGVARIAVGPLPTVVVPTTAFVAGSTRTTA